MSDITIEKVAEKQEEVLKSISEKNEAVENRLAALEKNKGVAELDEKIGKIAKDWEAYQEEKQSLDRRLAKIETLSNQAVEHLANTSEEKKQEIKSKVQDLYKRFLTSECNEKKEFRFYANELVNEVKALQTDSNPDGGVFAQNLMVGIINGQVFEKSPIKQYCTYTRLANNQPGVYAIIDNDDIGAPVAVTQREAGSEVSTPEFDEKHIVGHEFEVNQKMTSRMLQTWPDIDTWLNGKIADKVARKEGDDIINGGGTSSARGLLTYANWTTPGTYQVGAVEQIASSVADGMNYTGLVDYKFSLKDAYASDASYLMKRSTIGELMKILDGMGRPILMPNPNVETRSGFTLLGDPIITADAMPAVGAGNLAMVYGSFKRAYTVIENPNVRILRDPYTSRPYIKTFYNKIFGGDYTNYEAVKILKIASSL